ncbi:MAG: hypothetical protein SGI89_05635 [bacterium]|nr:hypothetical protein [bacterium]
MGKARNYSRLFTLFTIALAINQMPAMIPGTLSSSNACFMKGESIIPEI